MSNFSRHNSIELTTGITETAGDGDIGAVVGPER